MREFKDNTWKDLRNNVIELVIIDVLILADVLLICFSIYKMISDRSLVYLVAIGFLSLSGVLLAKLGNNRSEQLTVLLKIYKRCRTVDQLVFGMHEARRKMAAVNALNKLQSDMKNKSIDE